MNIMNINENGSCFILLLLLSIPNLLFVSEPANNCHDASDLKTNTSRSVSLVSRIFNSSLCILHFFGSDAVSPPQPIQQSAVKDKHKVPKQVPSVLCLSIPPPHSKRKRSSWGDIRQRMVISLYPGALGCTIHSGWFEVWGEVTFTISFIYPCRFARKTKRGYIYIKLDPFTTWVRLLFKNEMPRRLSRLSHSLTPLLLVLVVR